MIIRQVRQTGLTQLLELEGKGFTPEEAATEKAFINRIKTIPDTFMIAEKDQETVGYVKNSESHCCFISLSLVYEELLLLTLQRRLLH